jgi:hypothetical protein
LLIFGGLGLFSAMLLLLAMTRNYYLALVFMTIAGWGMLLYFSTTNTLIQMSVRRHAGAGYGHLGARIWGHDADRRIRSRHALALGRCALDRRHWRHGLRRRGAGDLVVCSPQPVKSGMNSSEIKA